MNKIRQVLRCYASGSGTKSISSMLNMSRNTVKKYLHLYQKSGLSLSEVLSLDDSSLYSLFQEKNQACDNQSPRYQELQSLLPDYAKRLKKKGVTRQQLFLEYQRTHPDGYARSRFGTYFQAYLALSHPVARLEHKAGDKMFIDYAGDKLSIIDRETGEILPVEVFVAILPCSQLTYVEAVMSQRKEDFIHACEAALLFYEGTPAAIVPDNLKAAVTKPSRYEAELNEDFAAFAEHYGCAVIPARVRKPRDKALVEGAVKLIYRSIYTKLEGREFYDLHSLNVAIRVALELHNNALLSGRTYSRREQFEELERDCMGPLNPIRFELKQRHTATVQKNGYVRLERHYYSVPYRYIGKKVNILYTSQIEELIRNIPQPDLSNLEQSAANTNALIKNEFEQSNEQFHELSEKFDNRQSAPLPPQKHLHSIELKSSKVVVTLVSLGVALLGSMSYNAYQFSANSRLSDNDIKFRYIKAMGEITPDNLFKLETIFEFEPDKQKQHSLRKMVEEHEQRVEQRARELEQARLKEAQAEQLRQEAESLKQKK